MNLNFGENYDKAERIILSALFVFIAIYLVLRAIYVPVLHDEAAIFFVNIQHNEFIPFFSDWEAGNHVLNSAITSAFCNLFGESLFVLRLGSLLFFPLFFIYTTKIAGLINSKLIRWSAILSLVCCTFLIEFFAFSRGYGISMSLLLGGIYFAIKFCKSSQIRPLIISLLFLFFATTANLTIVACYALLSAFFVWKIFIRKTEKDKLKKFGIVFFIGILPVAGFGYLGKIMNQLGVLYYGDKTDFWTTSVESLLGALFGGWDNSLIPIIFVLLLLTFGVLFITRIIKTTDLINPEVLFGFLFIGLVIFSFIVKWLFDANYPEDRTGLYFYPVFVFALVFALDRTKYSGLKYSSVLLFVFPVLFILNLNISHSSFWKNEQFPESAYQYILEDSKTNNYLPTVGMYQISSINWRFYNYMNKGQLSMVDIDKYPETYSDYQIVKKEKIPQWEKLYKEIVFYDYSGLSLLKRKELLKRKLIKTEVFDLTTLNEKPQSCFTILSNENAEERSYYVELNANVTSSNGIARSLIQINTILEGGTHVNRHEIHFNQFRKNWFDENFSTGFLLQKLPRNKYDLNVCLYDKYDDLETKIKGEINLYEVIK